MGSRFIVHYVLYQGFEVDDIFPGTDAIKLGLKVRKSRFDIVLGYAFVCRVVTNPRCLSKCCL
jgi:hypothetical protein